jgi:hypothetical protein
LRNLVLLFLPVVLLSATEKAQPAKKNAAKPAASAVRTAPQAAVRTAPPAAVTIPAGAVEIEPYLFRHTATDGKVWLYRKTPFGITKMEEAAREEAQRAQKAVPAPHVRVTEDGDTIRFERNTPMGKHTWEKKRAELTTEEKQWLDQNAQTSSRSEK